MLPLFGVLETLITDPDNVGAFVEELFGQAVNEVTSFVSEFPKTIMDNLGQALKEFLPNMLKDLGQKFFTGGIRPFFDLLDGIADGCGRAAKFVTKLGDAIAAAADGGNGNIAGAIYEGIKSTITSVLNIVGKLLGIDRLKDTIKKAREAVTKKVKELFKKILSRLKGLLAGKSSKSKAKNKEDQLQPTVRGKDADGKDVEIYADQQGKLWFAWNPTKQSDELKYTSTAESGDQRFKSQLSQAEQAAEGLKEAKDAAINSKGKKKKKDATAEVAKKIKEHLKNLKVFASQDLKTVELCSGDDSSTMKECDPEKDGEIELQPVDGLGRATGVTAILTRKLVKTGEEFSDRPTYWDSLPTLTAPDQWQRGHLLGNQLGGPGGSEWRNLIPQHLYSNSPVQRDCENRIRKALDKGECILFSATPTFTGNNLFPDSIKITAEGNCGFHLNVTIPNTTNPPAQCKK